jgi:hypothetical protein
VVKEGHIVNSTLNLIKANRNEAGFINLKNPEVARALGEDLDKNPNLYRMVVLDGNVRAIRMAGGGLYTTDTHHEEHDQPPMAEEFLVERTEFRQWYCEYVVKYNPHNGATLEDIQQYQIEFDQRKDQSEAKIAFNLEYAVQRLTEKIGDFSGTTQEMRHAEASGMHDAALNWKNKLNAEIADIFIYMVKVANMQGQRLDGLYYSRMRDNLAQLESGKDVARGTNTRGASTATTTTTTTVTLDNKSTVANPSRN